MFSLESCNCLSSRTRAASFHACSCPQSCFPLLQPSPSSSLSRKLPEASRDLLGSWSAARACSLCLHLCFPPLPPPAPRFVFCFAEFLNSHQVSIKSPGESLVLLRADCPESTQPLPGFCGSPWNRDWQGGGVRRHLTDFPSHLAICPEV